METWARRIAQKLLVAQRGGMDEPATWADVAARRGHPVEFYHDSGGGPGEFVSCEPGTGCIRVNTEYPDWKQARVLVHELGHAELCSVLYPVCDAPAYRMGYDDEPGDVRHRIAARVEELCFRRG